MNFAKNLQILRKMTNMTQEELAAKMNVSRQTVSKWEMGTILPEVEKLLELGKLYHCSIDALLQDNMDLRSSAYSDIRTVTVEPFCYIRYAVISPEPEDDAISHVECWAKQLRIENPHIIGWDFPHVSQEQQNVFHMRGYAAALILPKDHDAVRTDASHSSVSLPAEIIRQGRQQYITLTLKEQVGTEFTSIPNAYQALLTHMAVNGIKENRDSAVISCFEHEYWNDSGDKYMDIAIAILP